MRRRGREEGRRGEEERKGRKMGGWEEVRHKEGRHQAYLQPCMQHSLHF